MKCYALSHLSDDVLLRGLVVAVARENTATAEVLAHIAEVDARKLYLPAAYPSMFAYCVGELHLSEDAAFKRITAARMARRFPVIFEALAEGRLHLTALSLLAPHLTEDTAEELLAAASHKSKAEIELLLAKRFPRSDMLAWVAAVPAAAPGPALEEHAPAHAGEARSPANLPVQLAPERVGERPRVTPLSPQSFAVQFTMSQSGYDDLRHAQDLLGHQVASGDLAQVFELALKALIPQLEKRTFAATTKPRSGHGRPSTNPRHIPAHVRRAVWERDGGQCTFVGETGRRCPARKPLQFDHILEVARGGEATVDGMRLRCRAHNQYGAECTFGSEFMRHKREARAAAKAHVVGHEQAIAERAIEAGAAVTSGVVSRGAPS